VPGALSRAAGVPGSAMSRARRGSV